MKLIALVSFGVVSLLVLAGTNAQADTQTAAPSLAAQVKSLPITAEASPIQIAQATATKTGTFVAAEHPLEGMVQIVTENGDRYLEFDETFRSDSGPDLYVILHRAGEPPVSGIQEQDYVTLAPLQSTAGNQRYAIPADVNLDDFNSAVIWCRMFNATFGYATLGN
ncbi:DM13 domain-containing protein [Leptolyngbya sp. FACHB-541]|uniref:DM13 domain-containing protein n=1 Tax=Leptolyngbya sp. FACHB-541 TaxID=2692810 RepID=UPI001688D04B|nr:DM13 domain-containing protein [Leptolyngbya sp. FACHB-541]MBD1995625.1 DM13 domain-containing protein [Leptolyngbya sp. FACHB-541]